MFSYHNDGKLLSELHQTSAITTLKVINSNYIEIWRLNYGPTSKKKIKREVQLLNLIASWNFDQNKVNKKKNHNVKANNPHHFLVCIYFAFVVTFCAPFLWHNCYGRYSDFQKFELVHLFAPYLVNPTHILSTSNMRLWVLHNF